MKLSSFLAEIKRIIKSAIARVDRLLRVKKGYHRGMLNDATKLQIVETRHL